MPPNAGAISLTKEEADLVAQIEFSQDVLIHRHSEYQKNANLVVKIYKSITGRGAIPQSRVDWFTKPEQNFGRRKGSRRDIFIENARGEIQMIRHANFLDYLRYFIFGADLPTDLAEAFAARVDACGHVNGSDAIDLGKWARGEVRQRRLDGRRASEEFYKCSLDLGVYPGWAETIYKDVQQAPSTGIWHR